VTEETLLSDLEATMLTEIEQARDDFAEIEQLMEKALHKPPWPIDECVAARSLAAKARARLEIRSD